MKISQNSTKIVISSALAAATIGAAVARAAPDGGEGEVPEAIDVTESEKWTIFEYTGPEYELTLADTLSGEGTDPKAKIVTFQTRVRADLELKHEGSTVVLTDLDGDEGEADAAKEEQKTIQKLVDALLALLSAFGGLEENAPNFALTGIYDGVVWSDNGSSTDAVVRFTQHYGDIVGTLVMTDADMTVDAGCAVLEIPVSSYTFSANRVTAPAGHIVDAEADVTRSVRLSSLFGSVDVGVDVGMRFGLHDDFDTLEADFEISSTFPCSETLASGYFVRRPGTSPLP